MSVKSAVIVWFILVSVMSVKSLQMKLREPGKLILAIVAINAITEALG